MRLRAKRLFYRLAAAVVGSFLVTDTGDFLVTDTGDFLVWE